MLECGPLFAFTGIVSSSRDGGGANSIASFPPDGSQIEQAGAPTYS
jgi:hypothetical protein